MNSKFALLAGAALAVAAAAAVAQPAASPRVDRDADLTRQQVIERVDQRFARLDLDRDGRATAEEARQAAEQRRAQRADRLFERLDLDRNGSVTRAEFDQARAQRAEQRSERRAERGERGMRMNRRGDGGLRGQRMFGEQGFVTLAQMRERAVARFDRQDADGDGTLTAAERRQAREQRRQQRQERRGRDG